MAEELLLDEIDYEYEEEVLKLTKIDKYKIIIDRVKDDPMLVEFCENEIRILRRKAEKAKERALDKQDEKDAFFAAVVRCVGDEPVTAEEVFSMFQDDPDITIGKVRARLGAAAKRGLLVKTANRNADHKMRMYYAKKKTIQYLY